VQGDTIVEYGLTGRSPKRDGNRLGLPAPYDVYPCAGDDAWIAIAVGSDLEWRRLLGVLGRVDLLHDERFADAILRDRHRADIDDVVASWTRTLTPAAAAESLLAAGVAATPVLDAHGLVADPHVQSRGIFRTIQHPIMAEQTVVGPPWRFRSGLPEVVTGPTFGRDGERIFGDLLGLSAEAIADLVEREVIH
ncbi:MAG: CoA transferase, partial [Chloroflexi bacterium]|nr:CoA transferase [Chloroflexota bacterium]